MRRANNEINDRAKYFVREKERELANDKLLFRDDLEAARRARDEVELLRSQLEQLGRDIANRDEQIARKRRLILNCHHHSWNKTNILRPILLSLSK